MTFIGTPSGSVSPMATVVQLMDALSSCEDAQRMLELTVTALQRPALQSAVLVTLRGDSFALYHSEEPGSIVRWPASSTLFPLEHLPALRLALLSALDEQSEAPRLISDVRSALTDPCAQWMTAHFPSAAAIAVLPLRSRLDRSSLFALILLWDTAQSFSSEDLELYQLLCRVLSVGIGTLSVQRQQRFAQRDSALIRQCSQQLSEAEDLTAVLKALAQPAPHPEVVDVLLSTVDYDPKEGTEFATLRYEWPGNREGNAPMGTRYRLSDLPLSRLYLDNPDTPILVSDIAHDPRIDEASRQIFLFLKLRSLLLMALTVQGRMIGVLSLSWRTPVELGDRERLLYQALARHAALRLENSLMVERLRQSLQEQQQQGAMLRTVLDNIPIGIVFMDAARGRSVMRNHAVTKLLGLKMSPLDSQTLEPPSYRMVYPGTEEDYPLDSLPGMKAIRSGTSESAEMDILLSSGQRNNVDVSAFPVRSESQSISHVVVVMTDLSARKQAEAERQRMQEETLRVQAAALAERSSPLIPITDDILVLPLIGSIDPERGQQILDTVLDGAKQSQVRVAIIDITGVRTVDTQAASALTSAAQALRLLGVLPVLTGIRAEVAQTIVSLGVSLAGITTRSTLKSGIEYALRSLGRRGFSVADSLR